MVQSERQNIILRNSQGVLTGGHYLLNQGKGFSAILQEHSKTKATNTKDKGLTMKAHGREFMNTSGNSIFSSTQLPLTSKVRGNFTEGEWLRGHLIYFLVT